MGFNVQTLKCFLSFCYTGSGLHNDSKGSHHFDVAGLTIATQKSFLFIGYWLQPLVFRINQEAAVWSFDVLVDGELSL